jgi:hypothetical protein
MTTHTESTDRPVSPALVVLAWLRVLVPFCYGAVPAGNQDSGTVRALTPVQAWVCNGA